MSASYRRGLLVSFLLLAALSRVPAASAAPPTASEIARWIEQLGDNRFAAREEASKKLWAAGEAAEGALEQALKSDDAEVVRRARDILDKFHWGIYPDTPAEVVALLHAYQSTEGNARADILQKLLQSGPAALQTVLKIAKREKDPRQRKNLGDLISSKLPAALPPVLEDGRHEPFEKLLELGHDAGVIHPTQYTAYWLLRGKLEERIAHFRKRMERSENEKAAAETLVYLLRARGDLAAARKAAEKAERTDLLEGLFYEAADWKALAARPTLAGTDDPVEQVAFRAAYARLAGKPKDFEAALGELKKQAENGPGQEPYPFAIAKTLLLNDRSAEGLALLEKVPSRHTVLFEILCAQFKHSEAMKLIAQPRPADSAEQRQLDILKARTLYLLGEKDAARKEFNRLAAQIKPGDAADPSQWISNLLEAEYRVGLKDLAFEHCARALHDGLPMEIKVVRPGIFLHKVFPDQSETADVWWRFLRQKFPMETAAQHLKRLRDLIEGKIAAKDTKAWIEEFEGRIAQPKERIYLAEVASAARLPELAVSLLEKADTPDALTRLGDLLAGKKEWTKAADAYRQAWRKAWTLPRSNTPGTPVSPLPLYLAGNALVKAGRKQEGQKLMEQSHWMLLGDAAGRFAFLRALAERGYKDAARRETELLRAVSEPNSYHSGAALRRLAVEAAERKEYARAADGYEQSMLRCLHLYTSFVQPSAYVGVPAQIHQLRARAFLSEERFAEASKHIELAAAASPGSVDLAIHLVPELERRGRKEDAAALFARLIGVYEKLSREYPRCAWAHNSAAWMSACCRRNLDKGLEHARKAVELAPQNAGYLDTLAEIRFQRGEKAEAVALQKRVIELDPKKVYFRKQLRRLEAGDPRAERPDEEE